MRHVAQLIRRTTDTAGHDLLLGGHVEYTELHLQTATGRLDITHHDILGAKCLPVTVDDLAAAGRHADHILPRDRLENSGITQVIADDIGHVLGQHGATLPAERNHCHRNGAIGTAGDDDVLLLRHRRSQQAAEKDE